MDLWDVLNGTVLKTFKGHSDSVNSVSFSKDHSYFLSGSRDKSIRVWNINSGSCLQTIREHTSVTSVSFLADSVHIVANSNRGIKMWNAKSGKHLMTFDGKHSDTVTCIALSSDDVYIASGSHDNTVQVWDINNGNHFQTLHNHLRTVFTIAFASINTILASGSFDAIQLSDVVSGAVLKTINVDSRLGYHIYFSADQQFIVAGSYCIATELAVLRAQPKNDFDYQCSASHYLKNGWIIACSSQQRICWIPQAYWGSLVSTANGAMLGTSNGTIIILDFTNVQVPMAYKK
jgi:WD40 repeat protein